MDQETIDYVALRRLQNRYADVVTRRAWQELHDLFVPDIEVTLDSRDRIIELAGRRRSASSSPGPSPTWTSSSS